MEDGGQLEGRGADGAQGSWPRDRAESLERDQFEKNRIIYIQLSRDLPRKQFERTLFLTVMEC